MYLIFIFFRCSCEERLLLLSLSFEISLNKYFENIYADCLFFCNLTTLKKKMHVLGCLPKVRIDQPDQSFWKCEFLLKIHLPCTPFRNGLIWLDSVQQNSDKAPALIHVTSSSECHYNHGLYNLEQVLNFISHVEKSLNSVKILEKYLLSLLGLESPWTSQPSSYFCFFISNGISVLQIQLQVVPSNYCHRK